MSDRQKHTSKSAVKDLKNFLSLQSKVMPASLEQDNSHGSVMGNLLRLEKSAAFSRMDWWGSALLLWQMHDVLHPQHLSVWFWAVA